MHSHHDVLAVVSPWRRRAASAFFALALLLAGWFRFDRGSWVAAWLTIGSIALALAFLIDRAVVRIPPSLTASLGTAEGHSSLQTMLTGLWRERWHQFQRRGPVVLWPQYSVAIFLVLYLAALVAPPLMLARGIVPIVPRVVVIVGVLIVVANLLALLLSFWHWYRRRRLVAEYDSRSGAA